MANDDSRTLGQNDYFPVTGMLAARFTSVSGNNITCPKAGPETNTGADEEDRNLERAIRIWIPDSERPHVMKDM